MTLTDMLKTALSHNVEPDSEAEEKAREYELGEIKHTFKEWLKEVGLPDYQSYGKGGMPISATESTRKLLILLVDEP